MEYHFSRLANFKEVAHHILTMLINAADKYHISDWLFHVLPVRGDNYIWRDFGEHSDNLDKAIEVFQRFLNLKASWKDDELPLLATVYHNLASAYARFPSGDYLWHADTYYEKAIAIYYDIGDKASIAKVFLNKSICLFKDKRYSKAESAMWHSLDGEYITADNNPVLYSPTQYIWGNLISIFLDAYELQHSNEREPSTHDSEIKNMLDKGIEAFLTCIQLYSKRIHDIHDTDDSCERYFSFVRLANLYQKKEKQYHDGSWVLARYYSNEAKKYLPKLSEVRDFLGQSEKEIFLEDKDQFNKILNAGNYIEELLL